MGRLAASSLALLAFLVMVAGAATAGFVGSDDTVFNRPAELGQDGRPVLTTPDLLAFDGITVTLRASAPEGVFIGTAHPVDVAAFMGDSTQVRLTSVSRTGVGADEVGSGRPVRPASADFWTRSMSGPGVEELALTRDSSAAQWVIAPVGGRGPTTVSFGVTVPGIFRDALVAFGIGAVLLLVCVELLFRSRRRRRRVRPADRRRRRRQRAGQRAGHTAALTTALTTMLTTVVVLSMAGCRAEDLVPTERQPAELATTKIALTRAELPALLASYDARLRAAIEAARPPRYRTDKWRLADRGPALESDLFGTRVSRLTSLGRQVAPTHEGVEVFSARFESYPMWSLVASTVSRAPRLDLFTRASVQAPWLRQGGTTLTGDLPAPGRPSRVPDGSDGDGDRLEAATAAWRDFLRTGDRDDRLTLDPASQRWRDDIADLGDRAMFTGYTVTVEPVRRNGGLSQTVEVDDGMLALVALRVTTRLEGRPDLRVRWAPPYGRYRPGDRGVLSSADLAVGVIHLPERGVPTLLGSTFSEVAVRP